MYKCVEISEMLRQRQRACVLANDGHWLGLNEGGRRHIVAPLGAMWDTLRGNAG